MVGLLRSHTLKHLLRMAAVVEWSNAVFLWVNVDGKDYDNVFQKVFFIKFVIYI